MTYIFGEKGENRICTDNSTFHGQKKKKIEEQILSDYPSARV